LRGAGLNPVDMLLDTVDRFQGEVRLLEFLLQLLLAFPDLFSLGNRFVSAFLIIEVLHFQIGSLPQVFKFR